MKRNLFSQIGGFDEDYLMCVEDTDLCWRAWLTGQKNIYLPKAVVYHFQKRTSKAFAGKNFFYQGAKNNLSMIIKSAPLKILIWMLPLHTVGWILIAIKFLLQKRPKEASSVLKGILWHFLHPGRNLKKRLLAQKNLDENSQCEKIIFGKVNLKEIILKGKRWFLNV